MNPVLTKLDFVRRYKEGEFGNASPTWERFNLYWHSKYNGLIHFRNRVAGGRTYYNVTRAEAWELQFKMLEEKDPDYGNFYFSAMAPTEKTIIQGEVYRNELGLYLKYSTLPLTMRDALKAEEKTALNLTAKILLQKHLCSNSYEWLNYLLDTYDNHVIEFSTYACNWGTVPRFNTVFWEVRLY